MRKKMLINIFIFIAVDIKSSVSFLRFEKKIRHYKVVHEILEKF